jgi:hypothetical protein
VIPEDNVPAATDLRSCYPPPRERAVLNGGKQRRSALRVTAREAFLHCGKALIRSKLWDPAAQVEPRRWPRTGRC